MGEGGVGRSAQNPVYIFAITDTQKALIPKRALLPPGVKSARELAMERQRKMNERKS
jgi:hypothetical protein